MRVVAAQAAGQRMVAAVAMLTGGRPRSLARGPLPRSPQAAASCVVRLAAAAARLRVPGLRVFLLPPVTAATVGATAPAACRGQAGTGWGNTQSLWRKPKACLFSYPPRPSLPYLHCADCWRCLHRSCTPALGSLGEGCRGAEVADTGKGKPWAKGRPRGVAKGPACPGQRHRWSHRDRGGTGWPCLWRAGEGQMSWYSSMPPHP